MFDSLEFFNPSACYFVRFKILVFETQHHFLTALVYTSLGVCVYRFDAICVSLQCPADVSIQDGQPCHSDQGFCYQGQCPTRPAQCRILWGDNSTSSPDACYSLHNSEGSVRGHCGQAADGSYRKCSDR